MSLQLPARVGALIAVLLSAAGCTEVRSSFRCESDDACAAPEGGGKCEKVGFCSLPDGACLSGQRYVELSGPYARRCTSCLQAIAAGGRRETGGHACVLRSDRALWCWGDNSRGELGDGTTSDRAEPLPVRGPTGPLLGVTHVSTGDQHSCAVLGGGASVLCWGSNEGGQLGHAMSPPRPIPLPVSSDLPPVVEVAAGATHTCARTPGGQIWCWGANGYGELGDGTTTARPTPRPAAFEGTAVEVDTSFSRTCARRDDGSVWCWGWGAWGQLGNTAEVNLSKPERVRGLAMAVEVTNGNNHSCARRADRTVWCWGRNESGQIGTGSTSRGVDSAAQVQGLSDAVAVTAGGSHSCARRADGTVWCWGGNVSGELGVAPAGPGQHRAVAVQVPGLTDVVAIAAGGVHTCALRADGTIWCWGDNANGELGDGTRTSRPAPARALLSCP